MNDLQEKKDELLAEVETYAKAEYEVLRLRMVDNAARFIGSLLLTVCLILIAFAVFTFCAAAAVFALAQVLPAWAACLIIGAVYLLLIPVLAVCSKPLFVNPLIRKLSGLKNTEALKYETLRAEGHAAVQRERLKGHVRFVKAVYAHCSNLLQTAWNTVLGLFRK